MEKLHSSNWWRKTLHSGERLYHMNRRVYVLVETVSGTPGVPWGPCQGSTRFRWRSCNPPTGGGGSCLRENGVGHESKEPCPHPDSHSRDGFWNSWGAWGPCEGSRRFRWRSCNPSTGGGRPCAPENGVGRESIELCADRDNRDGFWNPWGSWGPCYDSVRFRWRNCSPPFGRGKPCLRENGIGHESSESCS